jgi:hypothetical protein
MPGVELRLDPREQFLEGRNPDSDCLTAYAFAHLTYSCYEVEEVHCIERIVEFLFRDSELVPGLNVWMLFVVRHRLKTWKFVRDSRNQMEAWDTLEHISPTYQWYFTQLICAPLNLSLLACAHNWTDVLGGTA